MCVCMEAKHARSCVCKTCVCVCKTCVRAQNVRVHNVCVCSFVRYARMEAKHARLVCVCVCVCVSVIAVSPVIVVSP